MKRTLTALFLVLAGGCSALAQAPRGSLVFDFDPHGTYKLLGVVGERVSANTDHWLLRAPKANPGMLAMFRLRDRQPRPDLVPWAGEFAGKYLISAVQACRLDADPQLQSHVRGMIGELIACQDGDGYLGPFPEHERLLKHWDLWGHYHIMLALLMWHEQVGDPTALEAACKMADLACRIYLDGDHRPRDAGSTEMNLAIIHSLGWLYRLTNQPRYLQLMREIETDWESEGDYLRTGLSGVEFYETPKPRWESLHDLQGLVELYRITGDRRYRTAFLHHWNSIQRLDRRNTGGFSSGEQATGTPFEPTAIETCCTIAWMALTVDALRLTGDCTAADELERSTYNGMLGAQHPSGCWWTYNTPMDGVREASYDTIVFQSRAGTPDLNCCSTNAPRGLGMLSEWALMRSVDGLVVNYYGPLEAKLTLGDGVPVAIRQQTIYPLDGKVTLQPQVEAPHEFALHLRIPGWSKQTRVSCTSRGQQVYTAAAGNGGDVDQLRPGSYCSISRRWLPGDEVHLEFDMSLRYESGGGPQAGKISLFCGPLLLAYDLLLNDGATVPPPLKPSDLKNARILRPARASKDIAFGRFPHWITVDIRKSRGQVVRLCDFATAGSRGNAYLSWLPAEQTAPPTPVPLTPKLNAKIPPGRMLITLRPDATRPQRLTILMSQDREFEQTALRFTTDEGERIVIPAEKTAQLEPTITYFWRVVAQNQWGTAGTSALPHWFSIDPSLPPLTDEMLTRYGENEDDLVVAADLAGTPDPQYGQLDSARGWQPSAGVDGSADGSVELDGTEGMVTYRLKAFPTRDYTAALWCMPLRVTGGLGQVFSAWSRGMDDPLRICVQQGELTARIEAGQVFSTRPQPIEPQQWYHLCVVKHSGKLTLYVDGKLTDTISVPPMFRSAAHDFALAGNPHFTGTSEHLACRVAQLKFWARALDESEIQELATR